VKKSLFLILIVLMLGMFTSVAFADDVDITVVPDKTSYEANETITLNVTVKNNTTMVMKNLSISNVVPEGLNYIVASDASATISEVLPNETAHHTIRLIKTNAVAPSTGDNAQPVLWISLIAISAMCMLIITKYRSYAHKDSM